MINILRYLKENAIRYLCGTKWNECDAAFLKIVYHIVSKFNNNSNICGGGEKFIFE